MGSCLRPLSPLLGVDSPDPKGSDKDLRTKLKFIIFNYIIITVLPAINHFSGGSLYPSHSV